VHGVEAASAMLIAALENRHTAAADIIALNAGAAIYVAGLAGTLADGVDQAREQLRSGAARAKLEQLIAYTQAC
jgi:anthranilate phosphoribosyltransferase